MTTISILRLTSACVHAATRAASVIRSVKANGELGIVDKGINDLQTEADRLAQRLIVDSISGLFPTITVIGEEQLDSTTKDVHDVTKGDFDPDVLKHPCPSDLAAVTSDKVTVWVDPLDGTWDYTQGLLDHVTVLIGICVSGIAVAGVIHQPYYNYKVNKDTTGRAIWGITGLGAFGITKRSPASSGLIVTTSRTSRNNLNNATCDALKPKQLLRVGAAGHKVLLVIEGKAHAYVYAGSICKKWDTAAPDAVLTSLGGVVTDIAGNPIQYDPKVLNGDYANKSGILATLEPNVHKQVLQKIPHFVKQKMMMRNDTVDPKSKK